MLNYDKANMKIRIQKEARESSERHSIPDGHLYSISDSRWFLLKFGRWQGYSLPYIAIHDPQYLLWLAKAVKPQDSHRRTFIWQANELIDLCTYIRPPRRQVGKEFVLFKDRKRRLRQISVCKVGHKLKPRKDKWKEARRYEYLDIHLLNGFSNRDHASKRLGRFLRKTYFRGEPSVEKCEAFFDERSHFARFKSLN